jgi:outer membrane biosynthesis protein TonB
MKNKNKNEIIAIIATLLLHVVVLLILVFNSLHYQFPPKDANQLETQVQNEEIMFGGEYVMLGNTPEPTASNEMQSQSPEQADEVQQEPNIAGEDLEDAGEPAKQAKPTVTSKAESPMKIKEKPEVVKPKKTGPASDDNVTSKTEKVKRGVDAATNSRVKGAFGKSSGNGSGKQGSPNGNSDSGALNGRPGIGGLVGYTLEYWGRPHSQWEGTVVIRVRVNTRGKVVEARCVGGTGGAYAHPSVRRDCEQESMKSAFSVPKNTTTEGIGTITWRFI